LRADVSPSAPPWPTRAPPAHAGSGWRAIDPDERQVLLAEAERAAALAERLRARLTRTRHLELGAQDPTLLAG
jgi:hypothetical protein